jgi:hypothetical protein
MCYGVLGNLFFFGDCKKDFPKAQYSLNLSSVKSQIKNSISKTNQQSRTEVVGSQVQNVTINGYTSGAPDIIITQRMNIKLASSTNLSSAISDKLMVNVANSIESQLESLAKTNPALSAPKNKKLVQNIQTTIANILKSQSAKYAIQKKMLNTLTVQDQQIIINFSQGVTPKIVDSPDRIVSKFHDGRPVIEIDQNLVNDLFVETTMESVIGEIVNNSELQVLAHKLEKNLSTPNAKLAQYVFSTENIQDENKENKKDKNVWIYVLLIFLIIFSIFFFFYKSKQ